MATSVAEADDKRRDGAFELSVALDHPSAGCVYLAVAIREGAPSVTGDRRLHERAVEAGLSAHVRWLGDVALPAAASEQGLSSG